MKVFAGTYQGTVFFCQGEPTELEVKMSRAVSENSIKSIASAGNQVFVAGHDQQFRAIHVHDFTEAKQSKDSQGVIDCVRYINNKVAVLGLESGMIRFWDIKSWSSRRDVKQHKKGVSDMKVDKNGKMLVSVGGRQMIFWNLATLKSMYHFRFQFDIEHVLLVDSFEYLFLLSDRTIRQINTEDNKEMHKIEVKSRIQCGLIFLDFLLIGNDKGEVSVWRHGSYQYKISFVAHSARIKDMKIVEMSQSAFLVTASTGQIRVWDILQFLKGVDSISQDYPLEGLVPLSSIDTNHRIICIDVMADQDEPAKEEEVAAEEAQEVLAEAKEDGEGKSRKKKKKPIQKQQNKKKDKNSKNNKNKRQ